MLDTTGRGSRREAIKTLGVAGAVGALGLFRPRLACAADKLVVGVIYVGPRDDYGYNQAQAQAAAAIKKMPGVTVVERESAQGLMAVALVIFARWDPLRCFYAALLFGGASALGPALQSIGITGGYYLFNAAPYVVTLGIMVATCSPRRTLAGAPGELSINR